MGVVNRHFQQLIAETGSRFRFHGSTVQRWHDEREQRFEQQTTQYGTRHRTRHIRVATGGHQHGQESDPRMLRSASGAVEKGLSRIQTACEKRCYQVGGIEHRIGRLLAKGLPRVRARRVCTR